jgi:hypothetical protein
MVTELMPCSVYASVMIGATVLAGWSAAVPASVAGRLNAGVLCRCGMMKRCWPRAELWPAGLAVVIAGTRRGILSAQMLPS